MDQPTFGDLEFQNKKRKTRRELFLERMDGLIPWQRLEERIRPYSSNYPVYNLYCRCGGRRSRASRPPPAVIRFGEIKAIA